MGESPSRVVVKKKSSLNKGILKPRDPASSLLRAPTLRK
jgi:hypothetical protein